PVGPSLSLGSTADTSVMGSTSRHQGSSTFPQPAPAVPDSTGASRYPSTWAALASAPLRLPAPGSQLNASFAQIAVALTATSCGFAAIHASMDVSWPPMQAVLVIPPLARQLRNTVPSTHGGVSPA